ncbi:hypothetical protein [Sphingomonas sp. 7/4-4]|uniref:hypothetical protein n=1 Tax=Sphingomonas sp. 7/4-4 TaxID=3018446 RepID=UPI00300E09D7
MRQAAKPAVEARAAAAHGAGEDRRQGQFDDRSVGAGAEGVVRDRGEIRAAIGQIVIGRTHRSIGTVAEPGERGEGIRADAVAPRAIDRRARAEDRSDGVGEQGELGFFERGRKIT